MLVIALLPPIVVLLGMGCVAFYICAAAPQLRRFALSASLWLAALAVLVPAAFLPNIALAGLLAERHLNAHVPLRRVAVEHVESLFLFNILALILLATAITLAHGFLVRRATFFLFRLYVSAVAFGVAITLAWISYLLLSLATGSMPLGVLAVSCSLLLTIVTRYGYRNAQLFRGPRPTWMQPVATTEYAPPLPPAC